MNESAILAYVLGIVATLAIDSAGYESWPAVVAAWIALLAILAGVALAFPLFSGWYL